MIKRSKEDKEKSTALIRKAIYAPGKVPGTFEEEALAPELKITEILLDDLELALPPEPTEQPLEDESEAIFTKEFEEDILEPELEIVAVVETPAFADGKDAEVPVEAESEDSDE